MTNLVSTCKRKKIKSKNPRKAEIGNRLHKYKHLHYDLKSCLWAGEAFENANDNFTSSVKRWLPARNECIEATNFARSVFPTF